MGSLSLADIMTLTQDKERNKKIEAIVNPLTLTNEQVNKVMSTLHDEMIKGLSADPEDRKKTSLQMENTFIKELLNGEETGDYLALDLGGTNFRVLLCHMVEGTCTSKSRTYKVPKQRLHGTAEGVFDHLAESIYLFLKEEDLLHKKLPLGFTFSFPMVHNSISSGILVTWTKSFACTTGVGQDAVVMLEEAISRRNDLSVDVLAVLNDTTGTLLAGSYLDKQCAIGLIMGTGCNAAYVERADSVKKWKATHECDEQVVIDTEWGAFGDNGSLDFMKTPFDVVIDEHSNHKGSFTFEKLFAGHYIGDLARLTMLKLIEEGLLFTSSVKSIFSTWGVFTANHLSNIERDTATDTTNTRRTLTELGLTSSQITDDDVMIVRYICSTLTMRSCQMISSTVATLLRHMSRDEVTIAIDGSVYRYHPHLHHMMTRMTQELAPATKIKYILAEDGSGRGGAFVAAVAMRLRNSNH